MDAPTYPPAASFEPPVHKVYDVLSLEMLSLADMMSAPAVWAIVLKHAPWFEFVSKSPQIKPHIANFTFDTFSNLGMVKQQDLDAINQELRTVPRSQWPAL